MAAETFQSRYFRGQGPLFVAPRDAAGAPKGLIFIGDLGEASLTPNVDRVDRRENVSGSNFIASSFTRGTQIDVSLTMRSIERKHLARALQGAITDKTGASVTGEAHTAYTDAFVALEHNKVTSVTVTDEGGTTTHTADTDYIVHADEGLIEVLSTGAIADASVIEVDYDYASQYHLAVKPTNEDLYLVFAGKNSADNDKQTRCELYKVSLDPSALSMITDEHADMQLSGRLLADTIRPDGDQLYAWKIEV